MALQRRFPDKIRAIMQFSNSLAHQIEAAADIFLMPSLYEPCGLNQIYSQIYGTIPIVRRTGGLADTVTDPADAISGEKPATGIVFNHADQTGLRWAIDRCLAIWRDPAKRNELIRAGMKKDWSWRASAQEYLRVYKAAIAARKGEK